MLIPWSTVGRTLAQVAFAGSMTNLASTSSEDSSTGPHLNGSQCPPWGFINPSAPTQKGPVTLIEAVGSQVGRACGFREKWGSKESP